MKINVEWLQQHVELPDDLNRLRGDLSMAGLVVESITGESDAAVLEL